MKRLALLFSLVMIMIDPACLAQDFAPIGAVWHYTERFAFWGDIDYLTIHSVKDTTIQGYACRRLDGKPLDGHPSGSQYIRYANDSLFRYAPELNAFQLLAAFNAQKGDSWQFALNDWDESKDTVTVTVNSVERITIHQQSLRKLSVSYLVENFDIYGDSVRSEAYDSQIIEKIGDLHYLFNFPLSPSIVYDGNYSDGLRCYEDAQFGFYSTGIAASCTYQYFWLGIKDQGSSRGLDVFPNPAHEWLYFGSSGPKDLSVQVQDLWGKCLLSETLSTSRRIDLSSLPCGLYIVTVLHQQKIMGHVKVVKN